MYGMHRSGHHGIIQWIMEHCEGASLHLDDVCGADPILDSARINTLGLPIFCALPEEKLFQNKRHSDRLFFTYERVLKNVDWQAIRDFSPKNQLILSYENRQIGHAEYHAYIKRRKVFCGKSTKTIKIIVLRDIHNYLASLLAAWFSSNDQVEPMMVLFKSYARQAQRVIDGDSSFVFINFNRWFSSKKYRIETAIRLGFKTTGEAFKRVPTNGGGSSFDGITFMGRANEMQVLQRWKHYQNNVQYQTILQDQSLLDLSNSLFGDLTSP